MLLQSKCTTEYETRASDGRGRDGATVGHGDGPYLQPLNTIEVTPEPLVRVGVTFPHLARLLASRKTAEALC